MSEAVPDPILALRENDVVRVVRLRDPARWFCGSEPVQRPPRVGDEGTVRSVDATGRSLLVESLHHSGHLVWQATFAPDELQFVGRPPR